MLLLLILFVSLIVGKDHISASKSLSLPTSSLAGAGIAGAVIATLAATILSTNTHLSTLELGLHWCHSHHKGLCACLLCVAHVWVHLAPVQHMQKKSVLFFSRIDTNTKLKSLWFHISVNFKDPLVNSKRVPQKKPSLWNWNRTSTSHLWKTM